jgi:hypothetical protein
MTKSVPPRKTTGEIGPTLVTMSAEGTTAKICHVDLPTDKEGVEQFFASRFVATFNETRPFGPTVQLSDLKQNDTSDLDFRITCPIADYMELAELNPRSEAFGRSAYGDGKLNIYDYSKWIFNRIIKKKGLHYGPQVSGRTMLLLYVTHWQFLTSDRIVECLRSHVQVHGCRFAAVFVLHTNGSDLSVSNLVHPFSAPKLPKPSAYSGLKLFNLPPGQFAWKIDTQA